MRLAYDGLGLVATCDNLRPMRNIVILISGSGSNMAAILRVSVARKWAEKYNAKIAAVISNSPTAAGLETAREFDIPTVVVDHKAFSSREEFDAALAEKIESFQPSLVVLAGFMRILTDGFVDRFEGRMINVHPSILPDFPGLNTHQRAIEAKVNFSGATVHLVSRDVDQGEILGQASVPILNGDTPEMLAQRVLEIEHLLYPAVIEGLLEA